MPPWQGLAADRTRAHGRDFELFGRRGEHCGGVRFLIRLSSARASRDAYWFDLRSRAFSRLQRCRTAMSRDLRYDHLPASCVGHQAIPYTSVVDAGDALMERSVSLSSDC